MAMTNPIPTDGPIPVGVIAGIDETVFSEDDNITITYVLAGVVYRDAQAARRAFQQLIAGRKGPFHWREEGRERREEAVTLLEEHVVATYLLARPTGIHRPLEARHELLAHLVAELLNDGVDHVIIESARVPANDGRDRDTIGGIIPSRQRQPYVHLRLAH